MGLDVEGIGANQQILDLRNLRGIGIRTDAGHPLIGVHLDDGSSANARVSSASHPIRVRSNFLHQLESHQANIGDFGADTPHQGHSGKGWYTFQKISASQHGSLQSAIQVRLCRRSITKKSRPIRAKGPHAHGAAFLGSAAKHKTGSLASGGVNRNGAKKLERRENSEEASNEWLAPLRTNARPMLAPLEAFGLRSTQHIHSKK